MATQKNIFISASIRMFPEKLTFKSVDSMKMTHSTVGMGMLLSVKLMKGLQSSKSDKESAPCCVAAEF